MPTHEKVTDTIIAPKDSPPIPTRVVQTKAPPRPPRETAPIATPAPQEGGQAPTTGVTTGAESPPPADSVKLPQQQSILARKEQAFLKREAELKAREEALASKLAEAEQYSQIKAKLANKDYAAAEALGINYEEYTKYLLAKQEGVKPEMEAIAALKAEVASLKEKTEETAEEQYEATVNEYNREIAKTVEADPRFITVKELKRQDVVLQLILDSWEEDDVELTVEDAAKQVEEELVARAKEMAGLTKLKVVPPVEEKPLPPPKKGLSTITQQVTTGSEKRPQVSLSTLSESQRYAEARRRVMERKSK